jgi:hypothetical protein
VNSTEVESLAAIDGSQPTEQTHRLSAFQGWLKVGCAIMIRQIRNLALEENDDGSHPLSHPATGNGIHEDSNLGSPIPPHPLGIKPLGNKYFSTSGDARTLMGTLQVLPDEMLMQLLEFLDPQTLRLFGHTCKFLFACCMADDIWKTVFLE